MAGTITIDTTAFNAALRQLQATLPKDAAQVLRDEMGLLVGRLIELTPPPHGRGSGMAGKKMGENAILADMLGRRGKEGTIQVGGSEGGAGIVWLSTADVIQKMKEFYGEVAVRGTPKGWERGKTVLQNSTYYDASGSHLMEVYKRARSPVTGRLSQAGRWTRDIGRWKAVDKVMTTEQAFTSFYNKIKSHVGRAKAGWMAAARKFKTRSVPGWVSRHRLDVGRATERISGTRIDMEAINANKAIRRLDYRARILAKGFETRARDMLAKVKQITDKRAREFSAKSRVRF